MTVYTNIADIFSAPVVALHSSASCSIQWKHLAGELNGRFSLSAPDLPGYGLSEMAIDPAMTGTAAIAAPVIEHIAEFGQPVHLVGHSYGAAIAVKVALMRPDLVKSLTVYEPAAFHFLKEGDDQDKALFGEIEGVRNAVSEAVANRTANRGMDTFIDFWNGNGTWAGLPEKSREKLSALAPSILTDFACGLSETWTLEDIGRLNIPTLVLMGLESPEVAQHVAVKVAGAIPNARLAMLPGLGHMAPVFEPEWVDPRICEHIVGSERQVANCNWPQRSAA
ncbi:alpha/beta fold hydrolase [Hoeflea sp. TYP-13]|uniref:alpha/beta fold hydrolase n=1 Tax=Hoeflea sp. TYP-13 TaxID=3230023 RepID=UPI0034C5C028